MHVIQQELSIFREQMCVAAVLQKRSEVTGGQAHSLLFSTREGTFHLRQNVLTRHFRPTVRAADLHPEMRFHDLRHTYATLALNAKVGVHLVSKMLGHASVKITIDLYGHALPDATAEAAATMNQVLSLPVRNDNRNA